MKNGVIEAEWDIFCKAIMPPDAPAIQRTEMRRAFYAGAAHMIGTLNAIGEPDVSEEDGCRVLATIETELEQFRTDLEKGRA